MSQRGDRASFALETVAEFFVGEFDGDIAPQACVAGLIHLAHAPGTNNR
jgi:hypothetical protein